MDKGKSILNKKISENEILNKMFRYCSYQERSVFDVRKQLEKYQADGPLIKQIIEKLIDEGFLNEKRFAETYTVGKLRSNSWGRIKIMQGLRERSIDHQIIDDAIESIDRSEYQNIIEKLIRKKLKMIRDTDPYIIKNKVARYIISKGFESHLVWEEINNQFDNFNSV
jgi:regulatory protein